MIPHATMIVLIRLIGTSLIGTWLVYTSDGVAGSFPE